MQGFVGGELRRWWSS